nr:hypothetical protein [Bacteroidota bacterium]
MKTNLFFVLFVLSPFFLYSQEIEYKKIQGVEKKGFKGLKSIVDKTTDKVFGHYTYYRQNDSLAIDFLDVDLNVFKHEKIEISKNVEIDEGIYNGESFLFLVSADGKANAYTYNLKGERILNKELEYSGTESISVFPSNDEDCYYIVLPKYEKRNYGYNVQKVDSRFNVKWEKEYIPEKGYISVEAAQSGNGRFILIQRTSPKLYSKVAYAELVCFDDINGDLLFKTPLYDDEITAVPSQILIDDEQNIIGAGEFFEGVKARNVKSEGIFVSKLSPSGETIKYNKHTWEEGIQSQLRKTRTTTTVSGKNKVYFHKLKQNEEGGYQLIGEIFSASKGGAAVGVTANLPGVFGMAGGTQNSKNYIAATTSGRYIGKAKSSQAASSITTQDFIIIELDSDLELEEVRKIEKEYTKIYIFPPFTFVGGLKLAKIIESYGFFDFSFTTEVAGTDEQIVVYNAAYAKHPHVGAFKIAKGVTPVVEKIEFKELKGDSDRKGNKKSGKEGQAGIAKSVDGQMLVYFFVKRDNKRKGKKNRKQSGAIYMYLEDVTE